MYVRKRYERDREMGGGREREGKCSSVVEGDHEPGLTTLAKGLQGQFAQSQEGLVPAFTWTRIAGGGERNR